VILLVALSIRLLFVLHVASTHDNRSLSLMHGDTREYVHLGENLFRRGRYVDEASVFSRWRGVMRPPGYPLLYAGVSALGVDLTHHLAWLGVVQLPFALGGVGAAYAVARLTLRSRRWATLAGTMSSLSPTGIAATAMPLADVVFGGLCAASLTAALFMTHAKTARRCLLAAAVVGLFTLLALLVKPAALPLVVVWATLPIVVRRLRPLRWTLVMLVALPALAWQGAWSVRNWQRERVFAYTLIGERYLLYLVVPQVQLRAELGRRPRSGEVDERFRSLAAGQERLLFLTPGATVRQVRDVQAAAIRQSLAARPLLVARVCWANLKNGLLSRYKNVNAQFPKHDPISAAMKTFYDATDRPAVAWGWLTMILIAPGLALAKESHALRAHGVRVLAGAVPAPGHGAG
jgi:hypothetical protein